MLLSLIAHAQETDATDAAAAAVGVGILGGLFLVWLIIGLLSLAFFIWWIVLIIDLTKRDFPQKSTYMILMIVSLVLGFYWIMDFVYYFGVVKKGVGTKR
jgi:Kef-type K+ transport system membrane component KefB